MKAAVKIDSLRLLSRTSRFLAAEGVRSYLVGGFVRDMLLGRDTADIDIAVAGDALEIAAKAANALGGRYVLLDEANGVGRVVLNQTEGKFELDFSTLKGDDILQDLAKRDFTIDAIAIELEALSKALPDAAGERAGIDLGADLFIDPLRGCDDLNARVVRAASGTAFADDPARLLRAVRLAAELDFSIDKGTEALIRRDHHHIFKVAGERIREELIQLLALPGAGPRLEYLDRLYLLTALFMELDAARGVRQPRAHVWDVFRHSLKTVAAAEFVIREGGWDADGGILDAVPWSAEMSQYFDEEAGNGSTRRVMFKLAALLHDIAKPQTKTVDADGRARFLGHPQQGAEVTSSILERMRFSTREIKLVALMVEHHLHPTQLSHEELPTHRAVYRYFRDTGEAGIATLFLSLADHLATRGPQPDMAEWQGHARMVADVLTRHLEEANLAAPPKLIDGHDLIESYRLTPGPIIGELLEAVREARAAGEVTTRQAALDYVKHLLADRKRHSRKESS